MARHEESSRSTCTKRWDEPSTSMSRRTRRQPSGCAPEPAVATQNTSMFDGCGSKTPLVTKSCVLRKVNGIENEAEHGNQRPRRTDTSAPVAETAAQANPVQTAPGLDCDSKRRKRRRGRRWTVTREGSGRFSAQVMVAILVASVTCVIFKALRQVRLFNTAVPVRTLERGT